MCAHSVQAAARRHTDGRGAAPPQGGDRPDSGCARCRGCAGTPLRARPGRAPPCCRSSSRSSACWCASARRSRRCARRSGSCSRTRASPRRRCRPSFAAGRWCVLLRRMCVRRAPASKANGRVRYFRSWISASQVADGTEGVGAMGHDTARSTRHAAPLPNGGSGEIRTHERVAPSLVFKTSAFNRSATLPSKGNSMRDP